VWLNGRFRATISMHRRTAFGPRLPFAQNLADELQFSLMSPEEKRARRRGRDRAAYARDPEKFRKLSRENRLKAGAAERHKEYAKAWALRNVGLLHLDDLKENILLGVH
jgi:hypothetical protein